jgi:hypothetical protein
MIFNRYGGPWQEFRAYVATVLFGWAQSIHFPATMDLAKSLAALEAEARQRNDATCDVPDARPIFINPDARP